MKIGYFLLSDDKFKTDIKDIVSVGVSWVKVFYFNSYEVTNSLNKSLFNKKKFVDFQKIVF